MIDNLIRAETSWYLGTFPNAAAVRAFDQEFLNRLGGSFDDIAARMHVFLCAGDNWGRGACNPNIYTLAVADDMRERGPHPCIFEWCKERERGGPYRVTNKITGRQIVLNSLVEHFAREHHFLEKETQFGCTAQDFYEHFMKD